MKAFLATISFEKKPSLRLYYIAQDWQEVHTSALDQFWPCAVSVRPA
ncbi:hypothetical protein [Herbaspirillum sp. 1130]|nr:hypothetical protein [Herbaspirillum sp. 1130]MBP1316325.1 hypothetical protein [Herbaspirillum sp. 1130]